MRTRAHTSNNYTDLTASGSRLARPETVLDTLTLILIVATVVLLWVCSNGSVRSQCGAEVSTQTVRSLQLSRKEQIIQPSATAHDTSNPDTR